MNAFVQFMHLNLAIGEVAEGPKPSIHSLHRKPFLFAGPQIWSLSSERLLGNSTKPGSMAVLIKSLG